MVPVSIQLEVRDLTQMITEEGESANGDNGFAGKGFGGFKMNKKNAGGALSSLEGQGRLHRSGCVQSPIRFVLWVILKEDSC